MWGSRTEELAKLNTTIPPGAGQLGSPRSLGKLKYALSEAVRRTLQADQEFFFQMFGICTIHWGCRTTTTVQTGAEQLLLSPVLVQMGPRGERVARHCSAVRRGHHLST